MLQGDSPGKSLALNGFRIGPPGAARKVYLQGALHADEQPGILILSHLVPLLQRAEERGELAASFVIFPMVNPVGMENIEYGIHQGRYDVVSGKNFNRGWPDLFDAIASELENHLGQDPDQNVRTIRQCIRQWLERRPSDTLWERVRQVVMLEACEADYVFDVHCDGEALPYIFCAPHCADIMHSLASRLGASAVLTAEDSGGGSFDEVWTLPFIKARKRFPHCPVPVPVTACTLEMRGRYDVFDNIARADAKAMMAFFQQQALVRGDPPPATQPAPSPTPLTATELLRVDRAGLLLYHAELGDTVQAGDLVAELLLLHGPEAFTRRIPVHAGTTGLIFARSETKYVWPGRCIAKIAGTEPLSSRKGYLLTD